MPRPSSFRAALAGLLTLGFACGPALASTPAVATGAATAAVAEDPDPLVVHLDAISPVLPRQGDVEISGTVTNVSDDTFTRVNLHAFSSQSPILDSTLLAQSATIDTSAFVGPRVTVPGTFATIDVLAPGESAYFSDSVPVRLLGTAGLEGVYWIGIHALGDTATVPRDDIADGRARTFIPQQPRGDQSLEASVILSIRSRVWYDDEGKIGGTDRWARRLEEGGSLDGVLDMADAAGAVPYSWLVDPAVLIALRRLALGNPSRNLVPDPRVPGQAPTPTDTPTTDDGSAEDSTATLAPPATEPEPSEEEQALAVKADAWLQRFALLVGSQPVLTLPFGDLDVSAAVRNDRLRFDDAVARSTVVMAALALPSQPAVAPTSGLLSAEAIAQAPSETVILLGDTAFRIPPTSPHSVVRLLGHKVVVTSSGAQSGGPGPAPSNDPLALRQRLFSEAALRLADDETAPLVVTLPTAWRGEDAASFFDELDQPWLDLEGVQDIADRDAVGVPASGLSYSDTDQEAELSSGNFTAARRATDSSTLMEQVLTSQSSIEEQVLDEALVTLSEQHRDRPRLAMLAASRIDEALRDDLAKIQIEVPKAVTLSSDEGPFGATLVNGLDQPVTVQVRAMTDGQLTITLEGNAQRNLGPNARSVLRYEASTSDPGVHNVRLTVASVDGAPLGSSESLPIRAARVSALIWIVMAAGALVLFGMIGYRLPGQIRQRRAQLAAEQAAATPDGEPDHEPDHEPDREPDREPDPDKHE